jgi:hypothetical protein
MSETPFAVSYLIKVTSCVFILMKLKNYSICQICTVFGSTYLCEHLFSLMNSEVSRLTDTHTFIINNEGGISTNFKYDINKLSTNTYQGFGQYFDLR